MKKFQFLTFILLFLFSFSCEYQHGLHPVQITGISGTVTFMGEWPEDAEWVRIICFKQKPDPDNMFDILLKFFEAKIGDPIPGNISSHDYKMELDPGVYEWIAVILNAKTSPFKVIGEYTGSDTSDTPIPITIKKEQLIKNVDMIADFNK